MIAFALCPFFVKSILFFLENKHYRYFLDIFLKKGSFGRDCRYFFKKKKEDNQIIVRFMHILQKKDTIKYPINPIGTIRFSRKEGKQGEYLDHLVLRNGSHKLFQVKRFKIGCIDKIAGGKSFFR